MAISKFTSGSTHTCYSRLCKYLESVSSQSCLLHLAWAFDCWRVYPCSTSVLKETSPGLLPRHASTQALSNLFFSEGPHLFLHPHPSLKPRVDALQRDGRALQGSSPISKLKGSVSLTHCVQIQSKMATALFQTSVPGSRNKLLAV